MESAKRKIRNHFLRQFQQEHLPKVELPMRVFKKMDPSPVTMMDTMPDEKEIKATIWSCEPLNAPGCDGFNVKFLR